MNSSSPGCNKRKLAIPISQNQARTKSYPRWPRAPVPRQIPEDAGKDRSLCLMILSQPRTLSRMPGSGLRRGLATRHVMISTTTNRTLPRGVPRVGNPGGMTRWERKLRGESIKRTNFDQQ